MVARPYILPSPSSPIASPARPSSGVVVVFHAVIVRRPTTTIVKRRYLFAAILHQSSCAASPGVRLTTSSSSICVSLRESLLHPPSSFQPPSFPHSRDHRHR